MRVRFLIFTCSYVVYIANGQTDYSLVIEYPRIGVHAVSRENDIWKRPCIYCQISSEDDGEEGCGFDIGFGDTAFENGENGEEHEEGDIEEEEEEEEKEVPEDEMTDGVFEVLFSPLDITASWFRSVVSS